MRIIAGKYRGRTLAKFAGTDVRPTPDRVKESVFQILSDRLAGARTLDLFCGSGALGLESLSRGAREAVFNDVSLASLTILRKNLAILGETAAVRNLDYRTLLKTERGQFDLIFADPPYREKCLATVLALTGERDLLADGGLVVYESEETEELPEGWEERDVRRYGRTTVRLIGRKTI